MKDAIAFHVLVETVLLHEVIDSQQTSDAHLGVTFVCLRSRCGLALGRRKDTAPPL